jgi:hypothetical protein
MRATAQAGKSARGIYRRKKSSRKQAPAVRRCAAPLAASAPFLNHNPPSLARLSRRNSGCAAAEEREHLTDICASSDAAGTDCSAQERRK